MLFNHIDNHCSNRTQIDGFKRFIKIIFPNRAIKFIHIFDFTFKIPNMLKKPTSSAFEEPKAIAAEDKIALKKHLVMFTIFLIYSLTHRNNFNQYLT